MPRYRQPLAHSMPWQLANHALVFPQEQLTEVQHFFQQLSLLLSSLVATSSLSAAASRLHVSTSIFLDISHSTVFICYVSRKCRHIHSRFAQMDMAILILLRLNARTCMLQMHNLSQCTESASALLGQHGTVLLCMTLYCWPVQNVNIATCGARNHSLALTLLLANTDVHTHCTLT